MKTRFTLLALSLFGLASCGTGTDPTTLLGDPAVLPEMGLPLSTSVITTITPYGAGIDGFQFMPNAISQPVAAPVGGTIVDLNTTLNEGYYAVTIMSSPRMVVRVSRLAPTYSVRVGDVVSAGQLIGTTSSTAAVAVQVTAWLDGVLVCPYSYFTQDARTQINPRLVGGISCNAL
jgi:hypothetical protein